MLGQQVEYPCEVREVFSGDDLIVMIDLGVENLFMKRRIRLHGVDTPNAVKEQKDTDAGKIRTLVPICAWSCRSPSPIWGGA